MENTNIELKRLQSKVKDIYMTLHGQNPHPNFMEVNTKSIESCKSIIRFMENKYNTKFL